VIFPGICLEWILLFSRGSIILILETEIGEKRVMRLNQSGIGDLYHQETKYRRDRMPRDWLDASTQPSPYKKDPTSLKRLSISPPFQKGGEPIWETIARRRSMREFSPRSITLPELSQLLWATQGITARAWGYDFRAVPSAGALYPIDTYVLVNRVESTAAGIYHYDVEETQLVLQREGNYGREVSQAALGQELVADAGAVFVWTAMVERSKWKYRERAYRYIYMDAGHVGQNLYLAATALGLGCCTIGAFYDEEVDRLIGVDGKKEISVYMGAVGRME
jgi:SagB-type dehydrogenase family enzyme